MMEQLTKDQNALYTKLVKEYNSEGWSKICSLDRFLGVKLDKTPSDYNLIQVVKFAANDY